MLPAPFSSTYSTRANVRAATSRVAAYEITLIEVLYSFLFILLTFLYHAEHAVDEHDEHEQHECD